MKYRAATVREIPMALRATKVDEKGLQGFRAATVMERFFKGAVSNSAIAKRQKRLLLRHAHPNLFSGRKRPGSRRHRLSQIADVLPWAQTRLCSGQNSGRALSGWLSSLGSPPRAP